MNRVSKQLVVALGLMMTLIAASPALAAVYLSDDFNSYADDAAVVAAGWRIIDVNTPNEDCTWTITNPGGRVNPPTVDGTPSTGNFMISDSDAAGGQDDADTGMSHDLWTPTFSTSGSSTVWLHTGVSAQLNNNGNAIFDVEVSTNGGFTWTNVFSRIAPLRGLGNDPIATTRLPDTTNADGYYGQLDVDLSAVAADKANVRVRFRQYEPDDDWWIAIDDVLIDDVPPVAPGPVVILSEDFSGSKGLGQMLVDTITAGGDETWNTNDPGGRYTAGSVGLMDGHGVNRLQHPDPSPPIEFAIIDTDAFGQTVDDYLMTRVLNLSKKSDIVLEYSSEGAPPGEEMRVLLMRDTGGDGPDRTDEIVKVLFDYKASLHDTNEEPFYAHRVLAVPEADGQSDVFFAWHWKGTNDWWWAVDDIKVSGVPEPSTIMLLASGALAGLIYLRRRTR